MGKSIDEYTEFLFDCDFTDEQFDPENQEDHLAASWDLFRTYSWEEIYPIWETYLYERCKTPAKVINFVNLYVYYEAADKVVPDPVNLISYLYYMVDMEKYWDEAGELFDSFAISVLTCCKMVNLMNDPYYTPLNDERIQCGITKWKSNKG